MTDNREAIIIHTLKHQHEAEMKNVMKNVLSALAKKKEAGSMLWELLSCSSNDIIDDLITSFGIKKVKENFKDDYEEWLEEEGHYECEECGVLVHSWEQPPAAAQQVAPEFCEKCITMITDNHIILLNETDSC